MKYLILFSLSLALFSCSKEKTKPNGIDISMNADIVENKWWAISLVAESAITSTGTVSVEWDVYNDAGAYLYHRSATVPYTFNNDRHSVQEKSTVQGTISMVAKNEKITSISGTGGYNFDF